MRFRSLLLCLFAAASSSARAVDVQALIQETQYVAQDNKTMNLVWWMPTAFWEESLKGDPTITEQQRADFTAVLDQYTVMAVARLEFGPFGGITATDRAEIIPHLELHVGDRFLVPLQDAELSPDALNFFRVMKPVLAGMLGQIGEGMEFVVYPNLKDGERIIDPRAEGSFRFSSYGNAREWRLPLGSLLPPMMDEKTLEEFPGNYRFNPFTGDALVAKAADEPEA